MSLLRALRGLLRRDVLTICLVVFLTDSVNGLLSPTFSLYAQGRGASLTLIGVLSSAVGLTQLLTSVPISLESDKRGRKLVLTFGTLCFAVATTLFVLAPNAYWLFPGRILIGLGSVSVFSIGVAYVADIVAPEERGLAYGLYATAMGTGFGLGPLIGAAVEVRFGIVASYLLSSAVALTAAGVAAWGLVTIRHPLSPSTSRRVRFRWMSLRDAVRDPNLVAASLGNLLIGSSFNGAIVNFFPMYAAQLGLSQATIDSMFSGRAFCSSLARLPTGATTTRVSSKVVMVIAVLLTLVALLSMSQTDAPVLLGVLLLVEGIAFGTFLTSGQAFIAEHSTPTTRGSAVGVYGTAGSLGSTLSPVILGFAADWWSVQIVFRLMGGFMLAGLIGIGYIYLRRVHPQTVAERTLDTTDQAH